MVWEAGIAVQKQHQVTLLHTFYQGHMRFQYLWPFFPFLTCGLALRLRRWGPLFVRGGGCRWGRLLIGVSLPWRLLWLGTIVWRSLEDFELPSFKGWERFLISLHLCSCLAQLCKVYSCEDTHTHTHREGQGKVGGGEAGIGVN